MCQRVCGASVGCSNIAYPKLVIELMPVGEYTTNTLISNIVSESTNQQITCLKYVLFFLRCREKIKLFKDFGIKKD